MKSTDVLKYLEGDCSEQEKRAMADWLDASPENVREFNEIRFLFEATKIYEPELKAWASTHGRIDGVLSDERPCPLSGNRIGSETDPLAGTQTGKKTLAGAAPRRRGMHPLVRRAMRIAAAVVVLLGVGYSTYIYTYDRIAARTLAMEIPAGQRIEMTLPDGSHVWLNAGARLEYPTLFGRHRREVKLTGEAMFDVEHDADHPFAVHTFASDVEVLGTKFNVEADADENRFATTLLEGRVRLTDPATRRSVILEPNDEARLSGGRLHVGRISDPDVTCWTEGLISVRGLSFEELMRKFERAYNVRIEIRRKTMPVIGFKSGKIRVADGVDHALQVLQYNSDFSFEHDVKNNRITIY